MYVCMFITSSDTTSDTNCSLASHQGAGCEKPDYMQHLFVPKVFTDAVIN